MEHLNEVGSES